MRSPREAAARALLAASVMRAQGHQCIKNGMLRCVRTTLTLDDDVAARLEQLRDRGRPFRQVVNDVLRAGLSALDRAAPDAGGPFTHPVSLGRPLLADYADTSEVLAIAEGEDHG